jgi:hypothetical protein
LKIEVVLIDEKMRKSHLRWFDHVQKGVGDAQVRKSELIQVEEMKKRQRKSYNNIRRS